MIVAALADDFTGANDCAGRLASAGLSSFSAPSLYFEKAAEASVASAETRFLKPEEARRRMQKAWASLPAGMGFRLGFQKIDSTLRGNPGSEILGLISATGASKVAFCAAYPAQGRATRGGLHFVRGVRLDKTEYARDPLSPARVYRVGDLFPRGFSQLLPRAGVAALKRRIRASKARVLCFDCLETRDLEAAVSACLASGIRFFSGASGLAGALGQSLHRPGPSPRRPAIPRRRLVLAGSVSQTTFSQLEALRSRLSVPWIQADGILKGRPERLALSTLPSRAALSGEFERARASGLSLEAWAERSLRRLLRRALGLVKDPSQAAWLLTGGHTAITFFKEAGLEGAWVLGEMLPGLPLLKARRQGGGKPVLICTKPGGFGREETMVQWMGMN